ncbi:NAD(P)H-dependent oxidoreductase [Cyanobium sp. AMD-g]|uniref:NADPH-dependent FMN reductase n=1 Tax=Cyanobium sp. AMD-g TaxID=2823699 RepID=UPI0020CBBC53|nr:NAD(P)H-dependent oxidoreductase [Cyanobium sp. AMD-g]MCP9932111.1 NAD(P)H-dependent oxidoreductase [Cyanobium sp. AMD-g]
MSTDLLVLSASNGENLKLAERFAAAGRARGMAAEVLDLTTLSLPLYNPRTHAASGLPAEVEELSRRLEAAPRWLICAPEYNGSLPPVLTSAIAWLSVQGDGFRSLFNGRPIAIATHSGGPGVEVLAVLRIQLAHLGANVVGRQLSSSRSNPAKDSSIDDIVHRLQRMELIQP